MMRPRLAVFRSNKAIYAQIIDDKQRKTLVAASSLELGKEIKEDKSQQALAVGELLAKKALKAGIKTVVFDRRHYQYHGRVKALADGARKGGLQF
ncbi:50S ribosomal protein L18 [Candidatus Shapirobacteria bacterium CG10_big_fil_rev_8_21_14_0_10_38_14]|uniref:Large ribosomal subunit protein uL18 n=1 Tax=Candidatus Shapirobacteria bacterium CG10_big_fil_rev_8_21_14_0_10_38_14 TaxID=1974483 RepID=A0A2M8L5S4_9BACT|nr:MAG: 50S ribosomal protein L18 [Candidatus Shapirobacteria bacterium CG10_big_fil_rev_8_21_14_0_10_38_14]